MFLHWTWPLSCTITKYMHVMDPLHSPIAPHDRETLGSWRATLQIQDLSHTIYTLLEENRKLEQKIKELERQRVDEGVERCRSVDKPIPF